MYISNSKIERNMHVFKLPALYNTKLTVVTSYKAIQRNMLKSFAYLRSKIFPKAYKVYIALRNKVIFLTLYVVQCVERSKPQRNIEWIFRYFSVYTFFVGCFICINRSNINQNNKVRKLQNKFFC